MIAPPQEIRNLVERFAVRRDVFTESAVAPDRSVRPVGYVVNLYGDDRRGRPLHPGDERCRNVLRALYQVAHWAVPAGHPACHIDVHGTETCLHYLKSADDRGRVHLEIHILHEGAVDRPLDVEERSTLDDLVERLETLGVS